MLPVLSREQMQAFDRHASEQWRVASALLMENAGRGAADALAASLPEAARVVVITGSGNNAGDGFVVARRLLLFGHEVEVLALVSPVQLRGDARANCDAFLALGGRLFDCSQQGDLQRHASRLPAARLIVDAIFGTGLQREVGGVFAQAIELINRARAGDATLQVAALDLPSGLDASSGRIWGACVRADRTFSFAYHKLGQLTGQGVDHCGALQRVDIGVPAPRTVPGGHAAELVESSDVRALLAARAQSTHKYAAGKVVVIAGSAGKLGAALLVGQAALRAGAGLVTLAGFPEVTQALDRRVQELMTAPLDEARLEHSLSEVLQRADALVLGPGVGLDERAQRLVAVALRTFAGPKIVDADALTQFAGRPQEFAQLTGGVLLTPHSGELARLLAISSREVEDDRFGSARTAAERAGATVLLKGACTLIAAAGQRTLVHQTQAPSLATAGSGDVLAGVLAALATQLSLTPAAMVGVHAHAQAARLWQHQHGDTDRGLLAHELCDRLPEVLAELTQPGLAVTD